MKVHPKRINTLTTVLRLKRKGRVFYIETAFGINHPMLMMMDNIIKDPAPYDLYLNHFRGLIRVL